MPPTSNDNLSVELVIEDGKASVSLDRFKGNLVATEIEASRLGNSGSAAFEKLGGKAGGAVPPLNLAKGQMQQLSFQVNDMATMLASGASPFQIMATQGGQVVQVFGGLNGTLAATRAGLAAVGLSLGGLAVFGGLAAAGLAVVKISENIRTEAERRLKVEEKIAGAMNRQRLLGLEIAANTEKALRTDASDRQFSQFLKGGSIEDLQRRFENLKRLQDVGGNTEVRLGKDGKVEAVESEASKRRVEQMRDLRAQIDALQQQEASARSNAYEARWDGWKKSQDSARRAEEEFAKSVIKGKERVKELAENWRSAFQDLVLQANAENPFVRLFLEGEASVKKMREETRGLSEDLRQQFEAMQRQQNALAMFRQRVDSSLDAFDLRETAARFRDTRASDTAVTDKRLNDAIARFMSDQASGLFRNASALSVYGAGASAASRVALFDFQRQQEEAGGMFRNTQYQDYRRSLLGREDQENSARGRFDRQLELLDRFRPGNDRERAVIDQKILALGSNLDPSQLDFRGREAIASAAERQAVRKEKDEQESLEIQRNQLKMLRILAGEEEGLNRKVEKGGSQALEILIKDETGGGVNVKRPTGRDTSQLYGGTSF